MIDNTIYINKKSELYSAIVWIIAGLSLAAYCVIGFLNATVPGVENLVSFLSTVPDKYIYLAAFISIFIEGLYFFGSFFPGVTLVIVISVLSQTEGPLIFIGTIVSIFVGWCFSGIINIILAKTYHKKIAKLMTDNEYKIKDRLVTTWFPSFRANYEVAQTIQGGKPFLVFLSSVRVKFWASIFASLCVLIIPLLVDINELSNREGFIPVIISAIISFVVGGVKLRKYFKSKIEK